MECFNLDFKTGNLYHRTRSCIKQTRIKGVNEIKFTNLIYWYQAPSCTQEDSNSTDKVLKSLTLEKRIGLKESCANAI